MSAHPLEVDGFLALLQTPKRPADLKDSPILSNTPSPLHLTEITDRIGIETALLKQKRVYKRGQKSQWMDANNGTGYFDDAGNFVLSPKEHSVPQWIVIRSADNSKEHSAQTVEGPFSRTEILSLHQDGLLAGTMLRRDFDQQSISAEALFAACPALDDNAFITSFIAEHAAPATPETTLESPQPDEFYSNPVLRCSSRLATFLELHNISVYTKTLMSAIRSKTRRDAIKTLERVTGLSPFESETLLGLLIAESPKKLLVDVDEDGFERVQPKAFSKRK